MPVDPNLVKTKVVGANLKCAVHICDVFVILVAGADRRCWAAVETKTISCRFVFYMEYVKKNSLGIDRLWSNILMFVINLYINLSIITRMY